MTEKTVHNDTNCGDRMLKSKINIIDAYIEQQLNDVKINKS